MTLVTSPSVIFLVRHAEKASEYDEDSPLSQVGLARAQRLAELLREQRIDRVYVTELQRTTQTASVVIADKNPEVHVLPANPTFLTAAQREFAALPSGMHALMVTHVQYLTPTLGLLGVSARGISASAYDHLFVVHRYAGHAHLVHLRYL